MNPQSAAAFSADVLLRRKSEFDSMGYLEFFRNLRSIAGSTSSRWAAKTCRHRTTRTRSIMCFAAAGYFQIEDQRAVEQLRVHPGGILFVAKNVRHRFHQVEEELQLLVFFSSAAKGESRNSSPDRP